MDSSSEYGMTIDGNTYRGTTSFGVLNPATEEVIAEVPDATREDLDRAIAAARRAFPGWAATSLDERKAALVSLGDAILAETDAFVRLLTREQGKPYHEAEVEVTGAGLWLKTTASLELPVIVNEDSAERYSETRHVPLGVVGAIAPWNFPLILAMFKVGPALLAGNTMVLKPSPFTPLTTLKFGEIASRLLPPGVLNIITGGDHLGPWMTEHPGFDKISFTGSTDTGKRVMQSASTTLKRLTLELGGNDAAIVMPDVDVEDVAPKLFWAAFANNGQVCIATKRLYVHESVYDRLKVALVAYAEKVKVGDGSQQGTQIGPLQNRRQYERVLDLLRNSHEQGHVFLTGGTVPETPGYFLPVTILDNPPEDARIVQEEQFGPILPLLKFSDLEDVITRVNASDYGLGGSVWGADEEAALSVAQRIGSGTVWVNEAQHLSPLAAFGGMKQSGLGIENGVDGLREYMAVQTIVRRRAG